MYVCRYVCMQECMYAGMYGCMYVGTYVRMYASINTYVYSYACICIHAIYTYIYTCTHTCAYIYSCVCIVVRTCTMKTQKEETNINDFPQQNKLLHSVLDSVIGYQIARLW